MRSRSILRTISLLKAAGGKFTEDVEHPLLCFGGGLDGWERGFPIRPDECLVMDTGVYRCACTDVRVALGDGGRLGHICFGPAVAEGNGSVERLSGS